MAYREGRSALEVATELYEEARALELQAETAHQNGVANVRIAELEIEREWHVLGHLVEFERRTRAEQRAHGLLVTKTESEGVQSARATIAAADAKLEHAHAELRRALDQKAEASRRLRDARKELDQLRSRDA